MSTKVICEDARQQRLMSMLFRKSGIDTRQSVLDMGFGYDWKEQDGPDPGGRGPTTGERMRFYAEHAGPLACLASVDALNEASIDAAEITHLVTVSCTGFAAPGVDSELINNLGISPTVERVHVGYMGCHGAINGLRVARGLAAADPDARILICAVELCSLHYRMTWDDEGVKGNALFSDGAAALVCCSTDNGKPPLWEIAATGSCLIPDSVDEMSWTIGDHGFEMLLSNRVPKLIDEQLAPWLVGWLNNQGVDIKEVGGWVVHPGGPRILDSVESALSLPEGTCEESRTVLRELGNMSSPTVLFVLDRIRRQHRGRPIVMLGFGPGLTSEVALLHEPA